MPFVRNCMGTSTTSCAIKPLTTLKRYVLSLRCFSRLVYFFTGIIFSFTMLTLLSALNYLTMENGTENPKQKENQGVKTDLEVVTFTYMANSPRGKT